MSQNLHAKSNFGLMSAIILVIFSDLCYLFRCHWSLQFEMNSSSCTRWSWGWNVKKWTVRSAWRSMLQAQMFKDLVDTEFDEFVAVIFHHLCSPIVIICHPFFNELKTDRFFFLTFLSRQQNHHDEMLLPSPLWEMLCSTHRFHRQFWGMAFSSLGKRTHFAKMRSWKSWKNRHNYTSMSIYDMIWFDFIFGNIVTCMQLGKTTEVTGRFSCPFCRGADGLERDDIEVAVEKNIVSLFPVPQHDSFGGVFCGRRDGVMFCVFQTQATDVNLCELMCHWWERH